MHIGIHGEHGIRSAITPIGCHAVENLIAGRCFIKQEKEFGIIVNVSLSGRNTFIIGQVFYCNFLICILFWTRSLYTSIHVYTINRMVLFIPEDSFVCSGFYHKGTGARRFFRMTEFTNRHGFCSGVAASGNVCSLAGKIEIFKSGVHTCIRNLVYSIRCIKHGFLIMYYR